MGRRAPRRCNDSDEETDAGSELSMEDGDLDNGFQDEDGAEGEGGKEGDEGDDENAVTNPQWKWPRYRSYFYRGKRETVQLSSKVAEKVKGEKTPFKVTYLERNHKDPKVTVTLHSSALTQLAKKILPHSRAVFSQQPAIEGRDLFLVRDAIREAAEATTGEEAAGGESQPEDVARVHARHLLRFVEEEYRDSISRYQQMEEQAAVSWDMLWTFLVPGELARFKCEMSAQPLCGKVESGRYKSNSQEGAFFEVKLKVYDYNLQSYRECEVERRVREYNHELPFDSETLEVAPLRMLPDREELRSRWLQIGDNFFDLVIARPYCFSQFEGFLALVDMSNWNHPILKYRADGRVMLDLWSFARMNPGYDLDNAQPPADVMRGTRNKAPPEKPSPEKLMLGPAVAYGFSFAVKKWGCFDISGIRDIEFDDDAFDDLVMTEKKSKDTVLRLVSQYVQPAGAVSAVDPISNKGSGCVVLSYGPPGTGKTLTAESVAEKLHRPLWAVSLAELHAYDAGELESRLRQIFEIAQWWQAILLFDEADVFLARRSTSAATQTNATTGVFLRLLEYFSGVLFLTTNRVCAFDEAFRSRISLFLHYPPLSLQHREQVWAKLLARAGLPAAPDMANLHAFNGREIRNIITVAETLAKSHGRDAALSDVLEVVQMTIDSGRLLQEATRAGTAAEDQGFGSGLSESVLPFMYS